MPPVNNQNNNSSVNNETLKVSVDPVFAKPQDRPANSNDQPNTSAYNVLTNQTYTPSPTNNAYPRPNLNPTNIRPAIRTYRDDVASAIAANHLSSVNIALAENERLRKGTEVNTTTRDTSTYSTSKIVVLVSVLIFIVGAGVIFVPSLIQKNTITSTAPTTFPRSLITIEYQDELNVDNIIPGKFATALASKLNDSRIPGGNMYQSIITTGQSPSKRLINAKEFVSSAELSMPDTIKRTLQAEFVVGMYAQEINRPFVIFKTSSSDNTFAGMLEWESRLESDFQTMFRLNGGGPTGLLRQIEQNENYQFEDAVVANKDIRQIKNAEGMVILLYSIVDKNTVIITVDANTFKELISRLNKEKSLER